MMMTLSPKTILLSTAYFAPIRYYALSASEELTVIIEKHEHYNKQSYRNRCTVYSANGLLDLIVPVVKNATPKIAITETEISYDTPWQKLHFKTIESAYRRSPFYEYYMDDLSIFFEKRFRFLYDYNMQIMHTLFDLMKIPFRVRESSSYMEPGIGILDLRDGIHPKEKKQIPDISYIAPHYTQVFADKFGFKSDLSILDLLFNTGPEAKEHLNIQKET